jgi:hypothetical protein
MAYLKLMEFPHKQRFYQYPATSIVYPEVISKLSIRFKIKAGQGFQQQEYK